MLPENVAETADLAENGVWVVSNSGAIRVHSCEAAWKRSQNGGFGEFGGFGAKRRYLFV